MLIEDKVLIKQFIEVASELKSAVAEQNLAGARQKYQQLYGQYQQINDSKLEKIHKEVAYQQLLTGYHSIQELKQQTAAPTNIIAIALVIIILSVIIFINPKMVGLAVFQEITTQKLNIIYSQNGEDEILLKTIPSSLTVTGKFDGSGTARLFAEAEGRKLIVFDSTKSSIRSKKFTDQCIDTCILPKIGTTKINLIAEIDNAVLQVDSISYYSRVSNTAPVWNGEPKSIVVKGETTIDFEQYFKDNDGDQIVYMAVTPDGISAEVSGSKITFLPEKTATGEKYADIIASDLKHTTKARIKLIIE